MSLVVWLPLNGDLRNLGASDIEVTNNGATVDNNGKIGKCIKITEQKELSYTPNFNTNSYSFSGWFKFNKSEINTALQTKTYSSTATSATGNLIGNTSYGGLGLVWTSNNMYSSNKTFSSMSIFSTLRTATVNQSTSSFTVDFDTWTHIIFSWNYLNRTLSLYKNGVLINQKTVGTFSDGVARSLKINYQAIYGGNGPSAAIPFRLNDVRIYNHCLSAAEVKEIAQGLVLHYKLDKNKSQLANAYNYPTFNTSNSGGGWNHWGQSGASGAYGQNTDKKYIWNKNNTYSHWVSNSSSATGHYLLYQSPAFDGGYRSTQCIVKEENGLPITTSIVYATWNAQSGGLTNNTFSSITHLGDGFYLCKAEGIKQDGSNDLVGFYVKPGYKVYFSEAYLENNKEMCSDVFEQDNLTTIEDSSGYGHNGEIVNTLTTFSNTPRYEISTYFSNSAHIKTLNFNFPTNIWTVSCWYYRDTNPSTYEAIFCLSKGNGGDANKKIAAIPNTGRIWFKGESGSLSVSKLNISTWTMLTMTCDGTTVKIYENSSLIGSFSSGDQMTECTDLIIGARANSANATSIAVPYTGGISDFRIYCTSLLDTDIKLLYNMGMRVDNLGGVHTFELEENQPNLMWRPENARAAGLGINWAEGLGAYTQSNCQVTCDKNGYRIYRPPNLTVSSNGNTMWGGLRVRNSTNSGVHTYNASTDNIFGLIKGHTYIFIITVEGKSSNNFTSLGITNNMGWGGGGLVPSPSNVTYKLIGTNFNGKTECYYKFTVSDDIVKTCTSTYSSFTSGNQYLSYMDFMFGFGYESTGSLGTDLYISNIRLLDVTNKTSKNIQKTGTIEFTQFIEKEENIVKIKNDEELYATEFIEI